MVIIIIMKLRKNKNMLEVGEYKNYKELCEAMGWKPVGGDTKVKHLKELGSICKYHKDGYKFIIKEVYETPLPIMDKRKEYKEFPQFDVEQDKFHNTGIYMIKLDNQVYIGSTTRGFRQRFKEHLNGVLDYMKHTKELLNNGGEFFILHDMTDIEDIELIRQVEEEYILFYTHETDYDVVNRRINTSTYEKPKKSKIKYKSIKIEENRLSEVLEILDERGVCYKYK